MKQFFMISRRTLMVLVAIASAFSILDWGLGVTCQAQAPLEIQMAQAVDTFSTMPETTSTTPDNALGLDQVIQIALKNNPEVAAKTWEIAVSEAKYDQAVGSVLPQLEMVGSMAWFRDDRLINPRRPGGGETLQFADQLFGGDVVLRMPLFAGGRLVGEIQASKLLQRASAFQLARTREELVFNLTSVFYKILAQNHVIGSLEFSQQALNEHQRRVNDLINSQKAAGVDLLRTEVRLADLAQKLATERNTQTIQYHVLGTIMGVPQAISSDQVVAGELTIPDSTLPQFADSIATGLRQRADYHAAQTALAAQNQRVRVAQGGFLPSVDFLGSYGNRWDTTNTDQHNEVGSLELGIRIPIDTNGKVRAKVRQEKASLGAAQQRLRELELQIKLEIETAILNIKTAIERIQATKKSIEQADETLKIEREKYGLAKGSITDVLDAQAALLDSQMSYYQALADYHIAAAQYRYAIGERT